MDQTVLAGGEFFVLGIIIFVVYTAIVRWRRRRKPATNGPVSLEKIRQMIAQLPEHLWTPAEIIGSTYDLFGGKSIRFCYHGADPPGTEKPLPACIMIIVDEKLCLFFYKDSDRDVIWTYDGFEAGDYTKDYRGETVR